MHDILLLNIVRDNSLNSSFLDCLGQHSIASYLEIHGYVARFFSGRTNEVKKIIDSQIKYSIKVVGFYVSADNFNIAYNIAKWIKSNYDLKVIIGGSEAVSCNENFIRETGCDAVIESEEEEPVKRFLDYLNGKENLTNIPNLKYIDENNTFKRNPVTYFLENLDDVPFPNNKNSLNAKFRQGNMVGILTGRGCPFSCSFCYEGANSKNVRFRSIPNVMAEIDYIIETNPNLVVINVYDDTFTLIKNRVYEFCDEIKKRNVFWVCEGHISNILKYPEMLEYMVKSNLVGLQIGIESGSDKVLDAYNKKTTSKDILEVVKICKKAGLSSLTGNFIIGGAFEDIDTFNESLSLAKNMIKEGRAMFEYRTVFLAPYPHTKISKNPEKFGLHPNKELIEHSIYTMHNLVMSTDSLSIDDIYNLRIKFNTEIEKTYYEQIKYCTRKELENSIMKNGKMVNRLFTWSEFYEKYEHITCFIKNALHNKIAYNQEYYPIRTFCNPNYIADYNVSDLEKEFLLLSDGKHSMYDISKILYLKTIQIQKIYYKLYERCFVYLSEF